MKSCLNKRSLLSYSPLIYNYGWNRSAPFTEPHTCRWLLENIPLLTSASSKTRIGNRISLASTTAVLTSRASLFTFNSTIFGWHETVFILNSALFDIHETTLKVNNALVSLNEPIFNLTPTVFIQLGKILNIHNEDLIC